MRTINAVSEIGIDAATRCSFQSNSEFEQIEEIACTRTSPAFDESAVAELIHDIRNTIGAVAMLSELTSLELAENCELRGMTRNVQKACQDTSVQCDRILAEFRGAHAPTEPTDLSALIRAMAPLLATWIPPASVLRFDLASDLPLLDLTPNDIRQVVMNLVKNAAEAVNDRPGIVTVRTRWIDLGVAGLRDFDGCIGDPVVQHVCLAVSDTGCGIDEPTRARLRESAYTTKPHGHGLGLASVRRIVAAHAARLLLSSRASAGTTACVVFGDSSPVNDLVSGPIDAMRGLFRATEDDCVLSPVHGAMTHTMNLPAERPERNVCDSAALNRLWAQQHSEEVPMDTSGMTMAQHVARAARDFQQQRTGHAPKAVTVVLSEGTLVVTLHEVLTPAELAMARTPEGADQVRRFHRELFHTSVGELRQEIERITGVPVREAAAEVETTTGTVVHVFTSGTMVQVFQLSGGLSAETWNGQLAGGEADAAGLRLEE